MSRSRLELLALASVAILAGCPKDEPVLARGAPVRVASVEHSTGAVTTRYSAQIVPASRVDLAFKVGGYVDSIAQVRGPDGQKRTLQEGDEVKQGSVLASLRKTDYMQKIAEARAAAAQTYSLCREARNDATRDATLAAKGSLPEAVADASRGRRDSTCAAAEGAGVRVEQAKSALNDSSVAAPMDGVIFKRAVEVGALAAPGTLAFSIADVKHVKAVFGVPDVFLSQIEVGAAQKVTTDAAPGVEFEGKVSRLAPSADQRSRVFEVDVTIPNPDGQLKAGMVAALSITPAAKAGDAPAKTPLVPLDAIVRPPSGKGFAVFVVESEAGVSRVRAREVQLGEYLGRVVPVKQGLEGNEAVVVQGAGLLTDGEQVEVIP